MGAVFLGIFTDQDCMWQTFLCPLWIALLCYSETGNIMIHWHVHKASCFNSQYNKTSARYLSYQLNFSRRRKFKWFLSSWEFQPISKLSVNFADLRLQPYLRWKLKYWLILTLILFRHYAIVITTFRGKAFYNSAYIITAVRNSITVVPEILTEADRGC